MGFGSWCQERWDMMLRTKPQCLPMLTRKRSSIHNPPKVSIRDHKCGDSLSSLLCVATLCCSVACGVLLVLFEAVETVSNATLFISLLIAGITCIAGGSCLSEYFAPETRSIYSCCYQRSGEILAFFFGWYWALSQASITAAICKSLTERVNSLSGHALKVYLGDENLANGIIMSLLVLILYTVAFTGLSETSSWHVIFGPLSFFLAAAMSSLAFATRDSKWMPFTDFTWKNVGDLNQILTLSSLCALFFSGPQNTLRQTSVRIPGKNYSSITLVQLNFVCLLLSIIFLTAPVPKLLTTEVIRTLCLLLLGIESLFPLHAMLEDMASDGLLFRGLSKKWRPCCLPVTSPVIQLISLSGVGMLTYFLPMKQLLQLSVVFVLLVNSLVPFLVLVRRYRDNSSWRYEPMVHTSNRKLSQGRFKQKSEESQYMKLQDTDSCEVSTACIAQGLSDDSSDTDIDSVVQQYKDQARIANLSNLDGPTRLENVPEPTPSSSMRAMACVGALLALSIITSVTLNFADANDHFTVLIVVLICIFFSTIVQGLLLCLPQNSVNQHVTDEHRSFCDKIPNMPWGPGIASLMSNTLLVHCLTQVWKICIGWILVGLLIYFVYGMNNSTAANSFYNMRPAHIALRPMPSYGNNCITQVLPSHRKLPKKQRKFKKTTFISNVK